MARALSRRSCTAGRPRPRHPAARRSARAGWRWPPRPRGAPPRAPGCRPGAARGRRRPGGRSRGTACPGSPACSRRSAPTPPAPPAPGRPAASARPLRTGPARSRPRRCWRCTSRARRPRRHPGRRWPAAAAPPRTAGSRAPSRAARSRWCRCCSPALRVPRCDCPPRAGCRPGGRNGWPPGSRRVRSGCCRAPRRTGRCPSRSAPPGSAPGSVPRCGSPRRSCPAVSPAS